MKCLICGQENSVQSVFCRKCKSVLPQLFHPDRPASQVNIFVGDKERPSPEYCLLYRELVDAASLLAVCMIAEDEFFETLDKLSFELQNLSEGIRAFTPGEADYFREEISLFESSLEGFGKAIEMMKAYPDSLDEDLLDEATGKAFSASRLLCQAVEKMNEALEKT